MNYLYEAYKFFLCFPPGQQPRGDMDSLLETAGEDHRLDFLR